MHAFSSLKTEHSEKKLKKEKTDKKNTPSLKQTGLKKTHDTANNDTLI
jgi:hypothetical protein